MLNEVQLFLKDIRGVMAQHKCDFMLINLAVDDPAAVASQLKAQHTPAMIEIITQKDCVTLAGVIDQCQTELDEKETILVMNCTNHLQHSQIEYCLITGSDLNQFSPKQTVAHSDVKMMNGENYYGEEAF